MFRKWRPERSTTKLKHIHHVNDLNSSPTLIIMVVWKLTAISKVFSKNSNHSYFSHSGQSMLQDRVVCIYKIVP